MCKFCWTLVLVLALTIASISYVFIVKGKTITASDGRTAILVTAGERDLVLLEMRQFLEAVQTITVAVNKDDMSTVVKAAKKVGFAAQSGVPPSLMKKLPIGFKKLGAGTHKAFDQLALDAESLGDKDYSLAQLGELMANCVSCHAAYQLGIE